MMSDTSRKANPSGNDEISDYLHADFDDLIFERRNKAYGAYPLRKKYPDRLSLSSLFAIALLLLILTGSDIYNWLTGNFSDRERLVGIEVNLSEPPPAEEEISLPPPPPAAAQPKPPTQPEKVKVNEQAIEQPIPPPTEQPPAGETAEPDPTEQEAPDEPEPANAEPLPNAGQPGTAFLEQMPAFPSGQDSLFRYLYRHIQYPTVAREKGLQGLVIVKFIIEKDGSVSNVSAVEDIGGGCGQEAVRVVKRMPKWIPGRVGGRAVKVQLRLPIEFRLTEE